MCYGDLDVVPQPTLAASMGTWPQRSRPLCTPPHWPATPSSGPHSAAPYLPSSQGTSTVPSLTFHAPPPFRPVVGRTSTLALHAPPARPGKPAASTSCWPTAPSAAWLGLATLTTPPGSRRMHGKPLCYPADPRSGSSAGASLSHTPCPTPTDPHRSTRGALPPPRTAAPLLTLATAAPSTTAGPPSNPCSRNTSDYVPMKPPHASGRLVRPGGGGSRPPAPRTVMPSPLPRYVPCVVSTASRPCSRPGLGVTPTDMSGPRASLLPCTGPNSPTRLGGHVFVLWSRPLTLRSLLGRRKPSLTMPPVRPALPGPPVGTAGVTTAWLVVPVPCTGGFVMGPRSTTLTLPPLRPGRPRAPRPSWSGLTLTGGAFGGPPAY